ncbi:hypothetical protein [Rugamonas sp. DEMB1]|uniref:hypothetical protein n=1 Tax=Rugamonas sp. DEMB1 TaxID=3039386 RepID=UPI002449302E|nr:hypothetical protein [Rugamonas sp. DEMB1]WGG53195.1 hypothetical protein QC826_14425 [Rugamonas sp. DEMB1]
MEIQDDTDTLRKLFDQINPGMGEVESVHKAELDAQHAMALMANPKMALKSMGIPVSDASQVNITMKNRADRDAGTVVDGTMTAGRAARLRRIIVIIIHYNNCDADIIIIATR